MGASLVSECASCGRRYVPARRFCMTCLLLETTPSAIRAQGTVLSFSKIARAGRAAIVPLPATIVLVRETGGGASFCAPLDGGPGEVRIGDAVALAEKTWTVDDGKIFTGIVARTK